MLSGDPFADIWIAIHQRDVRCFAPISECDETFAETFLRDLEFSAVRSKPLAPVLTRTGRDGKRCCRNLAVADAARCACRATESRHGADGIVPELSSGSFLFDYWTKSGRCEYKLDFSLPVRSYGALDLIWSTEYEAYSTAA